MSTDTGIDPRSLEYARQLVTSGVRVAEALNEQIFRLPSMRRWPNTTFLVGLVCAAAGFAHAEKLPRDEFLLLCGVAHDLIRGEIRAKEEEEAEEGL